MCDACVGGEGECIYLVVFRGGGVGEWVLVWVWVCVMWVWGEGGVLLYLIVLYR